MHKLYIWSMAIIIIIITLYLIQTGYSYYNTPIEERFYHPRHAWFNPSGPYGHGLGIVGTFLILFGVVLYIARKRYNFMARQLRLKYLLEFHIFLCTLGPILILFHTAFKFGGIVSIAFWSMIAVVLSGGVGRFIYIQIPRTIEGRALTLTELNTMEVNYVNNIEHKYNLPEKTSNLIKTTLLKSEKKAEKLSLIAQYFDNYKIIKNIKQSLKSSNLNNELQNELIGIVRAKLNLSYKISRLETMQSLFKYWHVAHLPFALIMLIVVVIHVAVTLAFGYKWIF